jgi:uncharacterized protein DUF6644
VLLPFFQWCDGLAISQAYRDSTYLFPLTQALHLLAVTVFVGAIVIGDLRMLGWGPVGQSRASIARSAQRILLWAGLAVLVTGIPQFTTNALTYHRSWLFVFKMYLLAAALLFTVTVRQRVSVADDGRLPSWIPKAVGAVSLALWIGVTISGRLITYYG